MHNNDWKHLEQRIIVGLNRIGLCGVNVASIQDGVVQLDCSSISIDDRTMAVAMTKCVAGVVVAKS